MISSTAATIAVARWLSADTRRYDLSVHGNRRLQMIVIIKIRYGHVTLYTEYEGDSLRTRNAGHLAVVRDGQKQKV